MFKIFPGTEFIITGKNFYAGIDTAVYSGVVAEANRLELSVDSAGLGEGALKIRPPLFEGGQSLKTNLNVNNIVGATNNNQQFEIFPTPKIDDLYNASQYWEKEVIVKGAGLLRTSEVLLGDVSVSKFFVESDRRVAFTVPIDVEEGSYSVTLKTQDGDVESTGEVSVIRPSIRAAIPSNDGFYYGDTLQLVNGKSLDKVTTVLFETIDGTLRTNDFTAYGSTGINVTIPVGVKNNSEVKIQEEQGSYIGGVFTENITQTYSLPYELNIKSNYIRNLDKEAATHESTVKISGVNLSGTEILFKEYSQDSSDKYFSALVTSSGTNYVNVTVPRGIVRGRVTASGQEVSSVSNEFFYPLPTIDSVSTSVLEMGNTIQLNAINAYEMAGFVGITGTERSFVSNPISESEGSAKYFGYVTVDHSSSYSNAQTGVTNVSAIINSNFEGAGRLFLVSRHEGVFNASNFDEQLSGTQTEKQINSVVNYSLNSVNVLRKAPTILGVDPTISPIGGYAYISGHYFTTATGIKLQGSSQSAYLTKSQFENQSEAIADDVKVAFYGSQSGILYEQPQRVYINTALFNFTEGQGQFTIY